MATLETGKVCIKTAGREAGRYCVVLKSIDENFVMVTGPRVLTGVKRRRCNVEHLEPTQYSVKIKSEASDKDVIEAYEKSGLLAKLGLVKPSPELVKEAEKQVKKAVKAEEKPKKEKSKEEVDEKSKKVEKTKKVEKKKEKK